MPSPVEGQGSLLHAIVCGSRTQRQEPGPDPLQQRFPSDVVASYDDDSPAATGTDPVLGDGHSLGRGSTGSIDVGIGSPGTDVFGKLAMTHSQDAEDESPVKLVGLLFQKLYPHARTVLIEISSRMIEIGEGIREWLGIDRDRVEWQADDVLNVSPAGIDFIYLYRPVRPEGEGRRFYERFARDLVASQQPVVIFSIADCLRDFLPAEFEVFYTDGHLTCFRRG